MRIAHDTMILVADGRKMLFFRNEGEADLPTLALVSQAAQADQPTREQGSDAPGRSAGTHGASGSTMQQTDFHQQDENRFAAEAADMLKRAALAGDFRRLIVVAPPRTLGELRKHYHKEVESRIVGEVAKDLTNQPVDAIARALAEAGE